MAKKTTKRASGGPSGSSRGGVPEAAISNLAQVSKLLSDETRLRILYHLLRNQELHVTDLCGLLNQSQPAVSHHLALLRVAGVIESRRDGKHNYYSVRIPFFSDLLRDTFGSVGPVPRRLPFHEFVLSYSG